jgi:hypothetical protein
VYPKHTWSATCVTPHKTRRKKLNGRYLATGDTNNASREYWYQLRFPRLAPSSAFHCLLAKNYPHLRPPLEPSYCTPEQPWYATYASGPATEHRDVKYIILQKLTGIQPDSNSPSSFQHLNNTHRNVLLLLKQ